MRKIIIESTLAPVLFKVGKRKYVAGGTIISVDGTPYEKLSRIIAESSWLWVHKSVTPEQIVWKHAKKIAAQAKQKSKVLAQINGYMIEQKPWGAITCTCLGYMYRKKCKHITEYQNGHQPLSSP